MLRRASLACLFVSLPVLFACPTTEPVTACTGAKEGECFDGYTCDTVQTNFCLPSCTTNDDCIDSRRCDPLPGGTAGVCRDGDRTAGDTGGGDPAPTD